MNPRVSQLVIYPIKSCGGCSVEARNLVPGGLAGDRRYMLVDDRGEFVTRRTTPGLCTVSVSLSGETFSARAPQATPLQLSFTPSFDDRNWGDSVQASVWGDTVPTREHTPGSAWFSTLLDQPVRLVYMPDDALRQVNPKRSLPDDRVSFADGYPLLLCTRASLDDLNGRLESSVPMHRFRPNVVIEGTAPFEEDTWTSIALGATAFDVPKGCDRCVMTTLEEGTGRGSKEPLKTLATFRKRNGAVWFGVNLIPRGTGTLRVGDELTLESP